MVVINGHVAGISYLQNHLCNQSFGAVKKSFVLF